MNRPLASFALAALISAPGALFAAPPVAKSGADTADVDQARTHFQRGADLYRDGNFDAALAEFSRAYELVPNYRVLYNIAQVQVERHDYVAAQRAFSDYLRLGATDVSQERRDQVEAELGNLKTRISELTVTSNVTGAEIAIDGVPVGTLPLAQPLLVSAGTRRVRASKRGYTTTERTISVTGGDKPELALTLEPLSVASVERAPQQGTGRAETSSSWGTGAWVSIAATGVFSAGAVGFGLLSLKQNDKLDDDLATYPANRGRVDDDRSRLKLYAGLTDGCAVAAGVSAALAVYFIVSNSGRSERPAAPARSARLVPLSNGVAVAGNF